MILRRGEQTYLSLYDLAARETALLLPEIAGFGAARRSRNDARPVGGYFFQFFVSLLHPRVG